jgi:hypothetical protein
MRCGLNSLWAGILERKHMMFRFPVSRTAKRAGSLLRSTCEGRVVTYEVWNPLILKRLFVEASVRRKILNRPIFSSPVSALMVSKNVKSNRRVVGRPLEGLVGNEGSWLRRWRNDEAHCSGNFG